MAAERRQPSDRVLPKLRIAAGDHDHRILVERDDLGGFESEAGIAAGNDDRISRRHLAHSLHGAIANLRLSE